MLCLAVWPGEIRTSPPGHISPEQFPPHFLHGVEHSQLPAINNIKRSTVNVYRNDRSRSESGVRVSASSQICALIAGRGNVLGGEGNCPGENVLQPS